MNTKPRSLVVWQRSTIFVLWFTYVLFYLGRVNLAVALPLIESEFGWSTITTGLVSSSFFWVYALGQLINGSLGDRLSTRYFIFFGLLGTALMNFLFGFSKTLTIMALIWGINGIFQSTGWGPIVKTATRWISDEERHTVSAFLGTSFVVGSLASWFLAGRVAERFGRWEFIFWVPASLLFIQAWIWLCLIRDSPEERGFSLTTSLEGNIASHPSFRDFLVDTVVFLRQPHFLLLAATTVFQGMIKDGINLWMPVLLMQTRNLALGDAVSYSLIVPFLGFVGVLLATWLNKKFDDDRRTIIFLFVIGALLAFGVSWSFDTDSTWLLSTLIGLCSLVINGINLIVLSSIPMRFAASGKASTLAGYLDFASYVGSGTMTILTGIIVAVGGWPWVALIWALLFVLGALMTLVNTSLSGKHYDHKIQEHV